VPWEEAVDMKAAQSSPWNLSTSDAIALQRELAENVVLETTFDPDDVQSVAGVDVGFQGDVARAGVVVLRFPDLEPLDYARMEVPVTFPYVPGLLAFREGPAVMAALERLTTWPDLFVFDAQGLAHPRRLGLASHLGVILDCPSIGCAKSRLTGVHDEPGELVGEWVPLCDAGEIIGAVVRTRLRVKPVFVSIGHRVDLSTAIEFVLRCTKGYRLPETTRYAHKVAGGAELRIGQTQSCLF
jgi:deoxyribonuclease V